MCANLDTKLAKVDQYSQPTRGLTSLSQLEQASQVEYTGDTVVLITTAQKTGRSLVLLLFRPVSLCTVCKGKLCERSGASKATHCVVAVFYYAELSKRWQGDHDVKTLSFMFLCETKTKHMLNL